MRLRKPSSAQREHASPRESVLLTATAKGPPPQAQQSVPEYGQALKVPWYRVVVEVTLHDRFEPFARLKHGIVHAHAKLLLDLSQFRPHALADRRSSHGESPDPVLPTDMFEAQEIERLGFVLSSTSPVLFGKPAEFDPARLFWV